MLSCRSTFTRRTRRAAQGALPRAIDRYEPGESKPHERLRARRGRYGRADDAFEQRNDDGRRAWHAAVARRLQPAIQFRDAGRTPRVPDPGDGMSAILRVHLGLDDGAGRYASG